MNARATQPTSATSATASSLRALEVVEYGDYECPYCRSIERGLREALAHAGDRARLRFRHFPISSEHPNAELAAEAAEAARAQGRFEQMHQALITAPPPLLRPAILECAGAAGLDVQRLETELSKGVHKETVRKDLQRGVEAGVSATPSFTLDSVLVQATPEAAVALLRERIELTERDDHPTSPGLAR